MCKTKQTIDHNNGVAAQSINGDIHITQYELSAMSDVIKHIIHCANNSEEYIVPRFPYSITDKIEMNELGPICRDELMQHHSDSFGVVAKALDIEMETNVIAKDELKKQYVKFYRDSLIEFGISSTDEIKAIINQSDQIYCKIKTKAADFFPSVRDVSKETKVEYIDAVTAYMFYECIVLVSPDNKNSKEV